MENQSQKIRTGKPVTSNKVALDGGWKRKGSWSSEEQNLPGLPPWNMEAMGGCAYFGKGLMYISNVMISLYLHFDFALLSL